MTHHWFDAHLDIAYLALRGRDMTLPLTRLPREERPAGLTFPSLREGGVRWALGTIFILPKAAGDPWGYAGAEDVEGAHAAGVAQLRLYQEWEARGLIRIVRSAKDLELEAGEANGTGALRVIILMEGADPIRTPAEAAWWYRQGLRVVGMAWCSGTRYAGGDSSPPGQTGLTDLGRALARELDALGIAHDVTHLHDDAAHQLLELPHATPEGGRRVIATHSSSRSFQGVDKQRYIPDDLVRDIAARGGIIGLPLYSLFLTTSGGRASVARTIDHLEALVRLTGRRDVVALGSDMDGGFGADKLPESIDNPSGYEKLAGELASRGWAPSEINGFAHENWLRYFREHLPK